MKYTVACLLGFLLLAILAESSSLNNHENENVNLDREKRNVESSGVPLNRQARSLACIGHCLALWRPGGSCKKRPGYNSSKTCSRGYMCICN